VETDYQALDRKFDAHHDATTLILRDILRRLPLGPA
jgi:hypothetical protein